MKKLLLFFVACLLGFSACSCGKAELNQPTASDSGLSVPTATPLSSETSLHSPAQTESVPSALESQDMSPSPEVSAPGSLQPPESTNSDNNLDQLTLDDFPTQMATPEELAEGNQSLYLVAQIPDYDTWLYSLGNKKTGLVLRIGDVWKILDLPYVVDDSEFPQISWGDFDGDQNLELSLLIPLNNSTAPNLDTDSAIGSGFNIWELHVIEIEDNHTWTDHRFDAADYQAILEESLSFVYDPSNAEVSVSSGGDWVMHSAVPTLPDGKSAGAFLSGSCGTRLAGFTVTGDNISANFDIELHYMKTTVFVQAATVQASIVYTGSVFGLAGIAIVPNQT